MPHRIAQDHAWVRAWLPLGGSLLASLMLVLVAACGGGGDGDGGTSEDAPPFRDPATPIDVRLIPHAALSVANADGSITFTFDQWDATLVIPAGALPGDVSPDDLSAGWVEQEGDSVPPPLARFRFGPDGLQFDQPALLELTVPLARGQLLGGVIVAGDGNIESLLGPGEEDFVVERVSETAVHLSIEVPHFSEFIVLNSFAASEIGHAEVNLRPGSIALNYPLESFFELQASVELLSAEVDYEFVTYHFAPYRRFRNIIRGSTHAQPPQAIGFWKGLGPQQSSDDVFIEGFARLHARFLCDRLGEFTILLSPELKLRVEVEHWTQEIDSAGNLLGQPHKGTVGFEILAWGEIEDVIWQSECVASSASPGPVSERPTESSGTGTAPTATFTPTDEPGAGGSPTHTPTHTPTPTPTQTATATPTATPTPTLDLSDLEKAVRELDSPTAFTANFSNGSCGQYPAAYQQQLTLEFVDGQLRLRQAQHNNIGPIQFPSGDFVVQSAAEQYDGTILLDGFLLRFLAIYTFDGCNWDVTGTQN